MSPEAGFEWPVVLRTLRCGLVGTGGAAGFHARSVAAHPGVELVAVTDHDRRKADEFAAAWGHPVAYDTLDELLEGAELDVLLICTPPGAHEKQALAAFAAGVHVIVEKPPAASLVELDEMRAAATIARRELAVVFQQRTGTAAAHYRGLLQSGALGRPLIAVCQTLWYRDRDYYAVPWRGKWDTEGGGTTLGHGIHQIDLLAYLLGDWSSVRAGLWRLARDIENEDASTATVTFANGVVASVITSAVSPRQLSSIRIDTQKATIVVEHLYGHGHENWSVTPARGIDEAEAACWALTGAEERSDHEPLLRDVFDALILERPLPSTADEPARSTEIVAAIYASAAANGAAVTPEMLANHPTHRRAFISPVTDMRRRGEGLRA